MEHLLDPSVSRAKFERELAQYRELEDDYLRRGWWMLKAEYPSVFAVLAAPQLVPPAVIFGVVLDFTNYDVWPPSVRLVDPFTRVPYKGKELPTSLLRLVSPQVVEGRVVGGQLQPLMVFHDQEEVPFLCLPGVREYHEHPAHTGDSWLLHRSKGEGTLHFILDKLYQYGVQPIGSCNYELKFAGFTPRSFSQ